MINFGEITKLESPEGLRAVRVPLQNGYFVSCRLEEEVPFHLEIDFRGAAVDSEANIEDSRLKLSWKTGLDHTQAAAWITELTTDRDNPRFRCWPTDYVSSDPDIGENESVNLGDILSDDPNFIQALVDNPDEFYHWEKNNMSWECPMITVVTPRKMDDSSVIELIEQTVGIDERPTILAALPAVHDFFVQCVENDKLN